MSVFAGKKIWMVGASEGIGEATARELAAAGAQIAVSARSLGKIEALAASLPGAGHVAIALDVTQEESIRKAWHNLTSRWGAIDVMFYNAGTYDPLSARDFNLARTMQMINVNFLGALPVLDCVIPAFVARGSGHIVLVGSVAAYSGLPRAIGYGASKAALLHLGENLRVDLAGAGVKVQVVSPGFVKTRLTDKNEFPMPFITTPGLAARRIAAGMASDRFEIHFPKRFSFILKTLRMLPYGLYFRILRLLPDRS